MSEPLDISAEVRRHLAESIAKRRFGVDYAYAVTWMPGQVQTPQGVMSCPVWTLLITRKSPLLGAGTLHHFAQLAAAQPTAEQVDEQVADGLRQLAALFERLKRPPQAPPAQRPPKALANGRRG